MSVKHKLRQKCLTSTTREALERQLHLQTRSLTALIAAHHALYCVELLDTRQSQQYLPLSLAAITTNCECIKKQALDITGYSKRKVELSLSFMKVHATKVYDIVEITAPSISRFTASNELPIPKGELAESRGPTRNRTTISQSSIPSSNHYTSELPQSGKRSVHF
jgi:hypothetical protein